MPLSRRIGVASFLLAFTACRAVPFRVPFGPSAPTALNPTGVGSVSSDPAPSPTALAADSVSPIPLHVGYGLRGSWFEVYFTDPANSASAQESGGVDRYIVEAIDSARLSVHLAIYSLTLDGVRQALIRAHRRGVDVRLVTESDNIDGDDLQRLIESGVLVLGDRREGSMHDKFMVIDGIHVWTGSMNYTTSGAYSDNNTVVHIESKALADNYEAEFGEMFVDDRFGPDASRPTPNPQVIVAGTVLQSYFSPDDGIEPVLARLLEDARTSVYFLAYSFTSNPLGAAIAAAETRGLEVRGVLDEGQGIFNLGTELVTFQTAGLDVRIDGNPGLMHEKVLIIDRDVVVVGSYNFSRNASETNDENLLIIHNPLIASQYAQEFERIYELAEPWADASQ